MSDHSRPATYRTFDEVRETLSPAEQRSLAPVFGASYGFMLPVSIPPIGIVIIVAGVTTMAHVLGIA